MAAANLSLLAITLAAAAASAVADDTRAPGPNRFARAGDSPASDSPADNSTVASRSPRSAVDLAAIRKQVRAYTDSLQVPDKPYGCYRDKRDSVRWNDIFSDRRLYQTQAVESLASQQSR